jgi:hypothetical protein
MNLKQKDSCVLVSELKRLVSRERELTMEIIHYMREVNERRIYLEEGYPSLYEWAVGVLKYSTGEAYRRISAMRLLKALPELEEKVESGSLSLTAAAQAQSRFREEDVKRKAEKKNPLTTDEKREITLSLLDTSTREAEKKLDLAFPESKKPKKLEITLSPELTPKNRHIPTALKNAVRIRDQDQCTYPSPEGKICGSKFYLEFEHLLPDAYGGQRSLDNLTLRCRAHNVMAVRKQGFGFA